MRQILAQGLYKGNLIFDVEIAFTARTSHSAISGAGNIHFEDIPEFEAII